MGTKHIDYNARTFENYREEFVKFSKEYYPDMADTMEDYSVGSWMIDLAASIGDNLSYYIDRAQQDTNINSTKDLGSVMNIARANGFRVPGPKASVMELEFRCIIPILGTDNNSLPDWNYAPKISRDTVVSNGQYQFQLAEDVDFAEQFNSKGYSNRKYVPIRNQNGNIVAYQVMKTVLGYGSTRKIFKKEMFENDIKPFMEVVLPDKNVCKIESVIFKENSSISFDPETANFFIDEEEFRYKSEAIMTYRYFETDSLSDQYRFGTELSRSDEEGVYKSVEIYDDYSIGSGTPVGSRGSVQSKVKPVKVSRIYRGEWKPLMQKFVSEYTDNGYIKIIFGPGVKYEVNPADGTPYGKFQMCRIMNNSLMGVLPKEGWTMFVMYDVANGMETNLPKGSINTINVLKFEMPSGARDNSIRNSVTKTISVSNITNGYYGRNMPSVDEIKWLMRYNTSSQNRAITTKDYRSQIFKMDPKYGCPFRCQVVEENNKIVPYVLGLNNYGKLDSAIPHTYANNLIEYLSHYKNIGDYIAIKSGKIINLGVSVSVFVDKNHDTAAVVKSVIEMIRDYLSVSKRDMGENIYVGDLERAITEIDGVISIISFNVYNLYGGDYSEDVSNLPRRGVLSQGCVGEQYEVDRFDVPTGGHSFAIDIDKCDYTLPCDPDTMYEIKFPEKDIIVKVKAR